MLTENLRGWIRKPQAWGPGPFEAFDGCVSEEVRSGFFSLSIEFRGSLFGGPCWVHWSIQLLASFGS